MSEKCVQFDIASCYIKMDKTSWTYDNKMVANIFSKNVDNELMRKKRDGHFETNEN